MSTDVGDGVLSPLATPRTLVEEATDRIRDEILSRGFGPGERLVEARLATQLGVSRGTVREALRALRAEGLVDEEPRRGMVVVQVEIEDVSDVYELRGLIEGRAARTVARARDSEQLAELRSLFEVLERAVRRRDARGVTAADLAFHDALCRLSGNARLHEVFQRYVPMLRRLLPLDEQVMTSLEEVVEQHREILEALESEPPERAARVCERHCIEAAELLVRHLSPAPGRTE